MATGWEGIFVVFIVTFVSHVVVVVVFVFFCLRFHWWFGCPDHIDEGECHRIFFQGVDLFEYWFMEFNLIYVVPL